MASVADQVDAVIGGDTHSQFHQLEIANPTAAVIARTQVANNEAGHARAIAWIAEHAPGPRLIVGLEGTRSYGIGLARALGGAGYQVVEVEQPSRKARRGKGKSDPIDAHHAVRSVLAMDPEKLPTPRADGDREALRILLTGYQDIIDAATARLNALRALLRTGDDTDRDLAEATDTIGWLTQIASRRGRTAETREQAIRRAEARRLALCCREAHRDRQHYRRQIADLVQSMAPGITAQHGVGPISAAQLILAFSHPGRCRNDAAFAALTGACPIPASSGKTSGQNRLNRGGDRQANRALHTIALTRMRSCAQTKAYVARRQAEGKTTRQIRRCLKRYIARQQYRYLTTTMT
jgi:transposase